MQAPYIACYVRAFLQHGGPKTGICGHRRTDPDEFMKSIGSSVLLCQLAALQKPTLIFHLLKKLYCNNKRHGTKQSMTGNYKRLSCSFCSLFHASQCYCFTTNHTFSLFASSFVQVKHGSQVLVNNRKLPACTSQKSLFV